MQNVTPFLWFDDKAEEAVDFYVALFKNSKVENVRRYGDATPGETGGVMTIEFRLDGTDFVALNGGSKKLDGSDLGPQFALSSSSAVSFVVSCESQGEVDRLWDRLCDGGEPMQCGWVRDRFGVTWQIVPVELSVVLGDPDPQRASKAMAAMLTMQKLDIDAMKRAARA
ncbi:MAG TPA: VOC family protein [Candidatus Cybelea sp.]|jgi:predicted 3-demethylubiquinone-9 3-methyltransferase (glyoxalase superfamily)|nr:VOC family protein [Candidatus Cybelea sp.]